MAEGKVVAICQYGGEFVSHSDGSMSYTGGDAHAVDINHDMLFDDFKAEISSMFNIDISNMSIKYFLPSNKRTLITISSDKDLKRMVDFNVGAVTTDIYILSKVDNRGIRSNIANSGTSIIASAAVARGGRRKRLTSGGRATRTRIHLADSVDVDAPPSATLGNVSYADQRILSSPHNLDDRAIAAVEVPVVAIAANADNLGPERIITSDVIDPSTPFAAYATTVNDVGTHNSVIPLDEIIKGVGQEFDNVKDFRGQLCEYAIGKGFAYKFIKNESSRVTVRCIEESCPWRIHASEISRKQKFVIKKIHNVHTCKESQRRATRQWLTSVIKEKLHASPNCKPKEIVREIYEEYGVIVTYSQVWRGREVAKTELYNTMKETYGQLPLFCEKILETNPGSVAYLSTSHDSKFRRFFVSFYASLHGFEHGCRPLLFLDRIPLKTNNQFKLLAAASVDGDDAVFPVAFAVVEDETYDSWLWFLGQLKYAVTTSRTITFVSTWGKGLEQAVPQVFENSQHSFCLQHLIDDLKAELTKGLWSNQTKDAVIDDFTRAAQACTVEDFNACIESVRNVSAELAEWVMASKPEHWSDAMFRGSRYDQFSLSIMDSLSSWIPMKHDSSIVQIVDVIHCKLIEVMNARRASSAAWTGTLTPSMEHKLQQELSKARKLNVLCSSETVFEVRGNTIYVVNIESWVCTCRRWQISGLPCMHAVAVCNRVGRSVYDYCSRYFKSDSYHLTYAASVNPIPAIGSAEFNGGADFGLPVNRRPPGRPRRKRINPNKTSTVLRLCSRCKVAGHNKATCEAVF